MLKIKLSQVGKKNKRSYRVVVAEARSKRDGKVVEKIGHYNPQIKENELQIKRKRLDYWIKNGAQMTSTIRKLVSKI